MTNQTLDASPRLKARIAGGLYVGTIVMGVFGLSMRTGLIVKGDAPATAASILASEPLYRAGIAADLVGAACYIGVTAMLYILLRPVNRTVSLIAAGFGLAGCAIGAAITLNLIAPLVFLSGAPFLSVFTPDQLKALAYASLRLHGQGYNIGMINFGVYCSLLGYLVFRSGFLPRAVGVLLVGSGLAWLTDSFATILAPPIAEALSAYTMPLGFLGEASLTVWLVAIGLDVPKWRSRAALAAA